QSDYDMPIGGNPKMRPCTCEEGHKLDCPMHGLQATKPAYEHIWDLQDHLGPKGGDEDMPRSWIHAIASETQPQQQRKWQGLTDWLVPEIDYHITHTFPDQWTIRHHSTPASINAVGK